MARKKIEHAAAAPSVESRMASADWSDASADDFVTLYVQTFASVYGVPPELGARERGQAVAKARDVLAGAFAGDPIAFADFVWWVFRRERARRKAGRETKPIGWRLLFSDALVTDYRAGNPAEASEIDERRAIAPAPTPVPVPDAAPFGCTDLGNTRRLVARHGADLRYAGGAWFAWDGVRWRRDPTGEVERRAKLLARDVLEEAAACTSDDERRALRKWSAECEGAARIRACVSLATTERTIAVDPDAFDRDAWLLNVENGTIELRTGELRAHRRDDLITKLAPVAFDAAATCPTWLAFLGRVFGGNASLVGYVQRVCGYMLTGSTREHAIFFFFGDGANGKSTATNTLRRMLGDFAVAAPRGLLMGKRGEAHPTELTMLHGARLALCNEVDSGTAFDESKVKDLASDEPITARRMREDFWTFEPTHKLVISGNHKPAVRGDDEGIWRRIRLVPFAVTIPPEERDRELLDRLAAESAGILRWCVDGCLAWQREGLGEPIEVRAATDAYREEQDAIADFVARHLDLDTDGKCTRDAVLARYRTWCEFAEVRPLKPADLYERLRRRGLRDTAMRGARGFEGASLRTRDGSESVDDFGTHPGEGSGAVVQVVQGGAGVSDSLPRESSKAGEPGSAAPACTPAPRSKTVGGRVLRLARLSGGGE
jgi:P4 family phage/plasmid primase-like protien